MALKVPGRLLQTASVGHVNLNNADAYARKTYLTKPNNDQYNIIS